MNEVTLFAGVSWVSALGWSLLHFLWQGAVVGILFAIVRTAIPRHHCNARYLNGLLTLLALAVLPVVTFFSLLGRQVISVDALTSGDILWPVAVSAPSVEAAAGSLDTPLSWIVVIWFAGVVFVGVRSWRQWRELIKVAQRWAIPDERLQEVVAGLASRFGFARHIRVLVSDRIDTPTLIGWIKPLILLPTGVALGFPRQQIELILAHELGHLRRYDHLVNLAQAVLETVLFYHPVVHWVARDVRNEREICCDELVLRVTQGEPREYAGALAALEEMRQPPVRLALAASGGVLLERVRRILFAPNPETTRFGMRLWLPLGLMMVVVMAAAVRVDNSESMYVDMPSSPAAAVSYAGIALLVPNPHVDDLDAQISIADLSDAPSMQSTPSVPAWVSAPAIPADSESVAVIQQAAAVLSAPTAAPELLPDTVNPVSIVQTEVPEVKVGMEIAEPVTQAPRERPVATRMVAPEYPDSVSQARSERVELSFVITANGSVRDIAVSEGSTADSIFVRAATRALRQWRFSPASVSSDEVARYRQEFVFAPETPATRSDDGCVRQTGSRLCRRSENDSANVTAPADRDRREITASAGIAPERT